MYRAAGKKGKKKRRKKNKAAPVRSDETFVRLLPSLNARETRRAASAKRNERHVNLWRITQRENKSVPQCPAEKT